MGSSLRDRATIVSVEAPFDTRAFELLAELEANNHRGWFDANRSEFRTELTDRMIRLLGEVSDRLADAVFPLAGGRRTMMRQHRDTRFADTAYHTSVRGLLSHHGGPLSRDEGGVHVELAGDGGFVGAGFHHPPAAVLEPIRRRMLDEPEAFGRIVDGLTTAGFELAAGRVKTMPRGFAAFSAHPSAEQVRRTTLTIETSIAVDDWLTGRAVDRIVDIAVAAGPLLRFATEAIERSRP